MDSPNEYPIKELVRSRIEEAVRQAEIYRLLKQAEAAKPREKVFLKSVLKTIVRKLAHA